MIKIQTNKKYNLRRTNRKDFLDAVQWSKVNTICIFTLLYNNTENTQTIIDKLNTESQGTNIDLIILDNSPESKFQTLDIKGCHITFIRPRYNLGSAGWYALAMEYILSKWYEYMIMMEDDIILTDPETFSETYLQTDSKTILFIHDCINTWWEHSRYVQYACYPTAFIQQIGIIDPRFYFRSEDLERRLRIEEGIKKYGYKTHILDKNYYHPYLKKSNGSSWRSYFSIRNQLLMFQKHFGKWTQHILIALFMYIRNSLIHWVLRNNRTFLRSWYYAVVDFIANNIYKNTERIKALSYKYQIPKQFHTIDNHSFLDQYKHYSLLSSYNAFSPVDQKILQVLSRSFPNYLNHGTIIGGRNSILLPLMMWAKRIVSIDEFVLWSDQLICSEYTNNYHILKGILSWLLFILAWIIYLPIALLIIIKVLLTRLIWKHL